MKVNTPEISWHGKEAIYAIDVQPKQGTFDITKIVTAGIDSNIRVWELICKAEKTNVKFVSNLSRHEKSVNIVRFSHQGDILASGADDATIILWKLSDKEEPPNIFDEDEGKNLETWNAHKFMRGHLEDVTDICWSSDDAFMVSGSIDYTAIIWDVEKGQKLSILSEAKHFIHGVAWDPMNDYVSVMSCDRSMRIYNLSTKRCIRNVSRMVYPPISEDDSNDENISTKSQKIFHDESVVRRRLCFTRDGNLMIVPAGCLNMMENDDAKQINTVYIFTRNKIHTPSAFLAGLNDAATVVKACPVAFQLRNHKSTGPYISLPYRWVFAVASSDTVLLYDTEQTSPFAKLVNLHYASITDLAWDDEAKYLLVSSRDGFCSIITFEENELGIKYDLTSEELHTAKIIDMKVDSVDTSSTENKSTNLLQQDENSKTKNEDRTDAEEIVVNTLIKNSKEFIHEHPTMNGRPDAELNGVTDGTNSNIICISDDSNMARDDDNSNKSNSKSDDGNKTKDTITKKRRVELTQVESSKTIQSPKRRIQIMPVTNCSNDSSPSAKIFEQAKESNEIISPSIGASTKPAITIIKPRRVTFTTLIE